MPSGGRTRREWVRSEPRRRARLPSPRATAARRARWRCRRRARRTGCAPRACACDHRRACATSRSPRDTSCPSSPRPCPRWARQPRARRRHTAPSVWCARQPRVRPSRVSKPRRGAVRGHHRVLDSPRADDEEHQQRREAPGAPHSALTLALTKYSSVSYFSGLVNAEHFKRARQPAAAR